MITITDGGEKRFEFETDPNGPFIHLGPEYKELGLFGALAYMKALEELKTELDAKHGTAGPVMCSVEAKA
jgi:hypothetical protein